MTGRGALPHQTSGTNVIAGEMCMKKVLRWWPLVIALTMVFPVFAVPVGTTPSGTVNVRILAVNDFHGHLVGPSGTIMEPDGRSIPAGGVEYLAAHIQALRAQHPHTVVVSAGDLIGASPLISALFHGEPTIEAFNVIGLEYNAVGNHEFDEGAAELLRMQRGGCHPVDGCLDGDGFAGATFQFLAANVVRQDTATTLFPAYQVRRVAGAQVAFVGMTLKGTPTIVTSSGVAGLTFTDEAETVNALVPQLQAQGIEAIVVLIHEGGFPTGTYNECPGLSGAIVDIVHRFDPAVDVVISGHTHQAYNCHLNGRLVTSASSFGRVVTAVDLTIDRATGEVVRMRANNLIVTREVPPDARLTALVDKYQTLVAPLANRVIGSITADITRDPTPAGESALGDVIADSQLAATADPAFGGAVVAFMNPGGIRADLAYAPSGSEGNGHVTYGEAFTVQPFGNSLVTMTLTGTQLKTVLEQQFQGCGTQNRDRLLQVSAGLTYAWSRSAPACGKVDLASITIKGVAINPQATYRVTVNSFLADGGDNFLAFQAGTDRLGGAQDLDALEAYFQAHSPVAPGPQNRMTAVP
jgi:5'-nucleotidase